MGDVEYLNAPFQLNEREHSYGERVHLISDPVASTLLARLCESTTYQPDVNRQVRRIYEILVVHVMNHLFPRMEIDLSTRMEEYTDRAKYRAELVDTQAEIVSVDIARAGILPSLACYELLNEVMFHRAVRQDHLMMSRATDAEDHVLGAKITGDKIGGPIDGRIVLFPDPMGATGSSLSAAIQYYKQEFGGSPKALATLNLIITPEFIRKIQSHHPDVEIYALRLDRGMSPPDVLNSPLGSRWDEEKGLNERDYIVPGGGGFGEIMNNAWI